MHIYFMYRKITYITFPVKLQHKVLRVVERGRFNLWSVELSCFAFVVGQEEMVWSVNRLRIIFLFYDPFLSWLLYYSDTFVVF